MQKGNLVRVGACPRRALAPPRPAMAALLCVGLLLQPGPSSAQAPPPRPTVRAVPARPTPPRPVETTASGEEVVPEEAKDGATPDSPISFDFEDQELSKVLKEITKLTGRNFDVDPAIANVRVTIITHDAIPAEMAYVFLESILASRGFSMVEDLDGYLIKITSTSDATQSPKLPLMEGVDDIPGEYDGYSTHVVQIRYAEASELQQALRILGSRNARIDTYVPTNTLIITDTADGLRRIFKFMKDVDVPGLDTVMEIFTLEYTRAEIVAQQLLDVLLEDGAPARTSTGRVTPQVARPTIRTTARPVPGAPTSQVIGSREEVLRIVPDERLNVLITVATEGMMERARHLLTLLDTPMSPDKNNLHIYPLLNADAEKVEAALQPLLSTTPRRQAGQGGPGAGQTAEVHPFEQQVQITRYDQTNSLLIVAGWQDYQRLAAFIAQLDVPPRQVYVDVMVMDVTINNDYNLNVDLAALSNNDVFGVTTSSNIAALSGITTVAQALASGSSPAQASAAARALIGTSILGMGTGGFTAGVFHDLRMNVDGLDVTVPFVPMLVKAVELLTNVEVLSQPSLVTVDNNEEGASIIVGQQVPFITNTGRPAVDAQGFSQSFSSGYTSVTRQDVGVKLTVIPQITEGDNVLLYLDIEISDIASTSVGDINIVGPTMNLTNIQNQVLVKDGATALIAGLIRDTAGSTQRQTPILGDLPLFGWLFKSKSDFQNKRNMVVLVTPHIVKEGTDFERVTQYKVGEYHDINVAEFFDQGFFKKVRKKSATRKRHRPTLSRSEALTSGSPNFGRGDLER